ncbi:MAG: hypothetical protein JWO53_138 [Chlamydiia bacterium]|nr:hypothetical protein [Chlamydiia bacterium]
MVSSLRTLSSGDVFVRINKQNEKGPVHAKITTKRLELHPVIHSDTENYTHLFGDAGVMAKYASGKPLTKTEVEARYKMGKSMV